MTLQYGKKYKVREHNATYYEIVTVDQVSSKGVVTIRLGGLFGGRLDLTPKRVAQLTWEEHQTKGTQWNTQNNEQRNTQKVRVRHQRWCYKNQKICGVLYTTRRCHENQQQRNNRQTDTLQICDHQQKQKCDKGHEKRTCNSLDSVLQYTTTTTEKRIQQWNTRLAR